MNTKIVLSLSALAVFSALAFNALQPVTPASALDSATPRYGTPGPHTDCPSYEDTQALLKAGDYQAWADAKQGRGVTRFVNETNFKEFADAHLSGDASKLQAFREKYGMGQQNGQGRGQGMGYGRNQAR